jgi:PKD repeat protein
MKTRSTSQLRQDAGSTRNRSASVAASRSLGEGGFFNPRIGMALALCSVGALLAMLGFASTPSSGTLTDTSGPLNYTAGPFFVANPTPILFVDNGPECSGSAQPCDSYALTVTLPAGYTANHPNASVKVTLSWTDAGSGSSDYDLYIFRGVVGNTDGSQSADYQSASSSNPEIATISPLVDGTQQYTIKVVPYTPTGETVRVQIELLPGSGGGGGGFGGPDPTVPGVPRYQNFFAPPGSSAEPSNGEFNIGFNPHTGRIMVMNIGPIWRLTPPELLTPAKPECCEALWEDKSTLTLNTGLDPILWTDQVTGRTFASNSTVGANAVYGYSDNDGDLWIEAGFSPPNGGADHESIGSGPYPASLSALRNQINHGEAVYYCSQSIVGPAACQRSDTLGASYGPGVLAYDGVTTQCGGLHGHVHVAPNGTVWLPVKGCGSTQGGATSTDGGVTWHEFLVTGSKPQTAGADPSVAIDSDSTAYFCYVNDEPVPPGNPPEGHAHCKVSTDGGNTWIRDFDLGASHGIKNAVHIEAVGGSSGRAACGFLGTNVAGDYQSNSFPGKWYAFIATTYDGGQTWTTVNATPNDPVQSMTGVWQQGGSHQDRNLLDFNEITVDANGRVLYGYSDGCVTEGCIAGTAANDFTAFMRVARQSGGKPLFSQFDPTEPVAPKPPCLSGTRDANGSHLTWKAPDNGGSDIVGYQVLRGTTSGGESVLVANTGNRKTTFDDTTADPSVPHYFYQVKAINAIGIGNASNEIDLTVQVQPTETVCAVPGLTKLTDAQGDTSAAIGIITTPAPPGADLKSFQIAQPYAEDGVIKLVFTINTWDNGQSPQPTGSAWYVAMKIPDPGGNTFHYRGVHMAWYPTSPTTPTFESYTPAPNTSGGVDGRFVTPGSQRPAEATSAYAPPYNKVVIVVKASDLGLNPGDTIAGFVSGVSQSTDPGLNIGVGATALFDQMPDSLAFTGSYTVNNNDFCRPNAAPTAVLTATPTSGNAPLTVNFDGSGSYDPDPGDTIASYTFSFGDGSPAVTQSAPTIAHTYNAAGNYAARLTVTDSRGLASTNTAQVIITVTSSPTPTPTPTPSPAPCNGTAVEDDDSHIAYSNGWHLINDADASAGHFRLNEGGNNQHNAVLTFTTPPNQTGTITYFYATSPKGGSAEVFVDGQDMGPVNYNGPSGSNRSPVFGVSRTYSYGARANGQHTLEIRPIHDGIYIDRFCIGNATATGTPAAHPGTTSQSDLSLSAGQTSLNPITLGTGTQAIAVAAESNLAVPIRLVLIDPLGVVLQTVDSATGLVVLESPITRSGVYVIQVVNLSLGPVQVWSVATPQVSTR